MAERLKYVSAEYQERLEALANLLVTPERFGRVALADTVEFPVISEQLELDYGTDSE